ncbi:interleukin-22 [Danio rerio]|uniref:Interleukin-22 n=1 Tax=Danio rerio TaxID=7955 RepID=Q5TLE4_DANRE|nr:interleukin-22 [Danio rerio]BAD72867.1 interleukin 22 [Danio rerio]|eukprot:NP_001018628.1 interleukin 22 [Danio rerio]
MGDYAKGEKTTTVTYRHDIKAPEPQDALQVSTSRNNGVHKRTDTRIHSSTCDMKCFTLIALLCSCFLSGCARPTPLDSSATWNDLAAMTDTARNEDDHETRLLPYFSHDMLQEEGSCCINARILKYYVNHVLESDEHTDMKYPMIRNVREGLHRVEQELQNHCKHDYSSHPLVKQFKRNYHASAIMDLAAARNKAIGETNTLYHYLFESCTPK